MKTFFANSFLNFLFFFILMVSIFVYMEISLNIRLNPWVQGGLIALVGMFSDYIKKRCRESLKGSED